MDRLRAEISAENAIQTELNCQRNRYWSQDCSSAYERHSMKRIIVVVLLGSDSRELRHCALARNNYARSSQLSQVVDGEKSGGDAREEIRKSMSFHLVRA